LALAVAGGEFPVARAAIDSLWRGRRVQEGEGALRGAGAGLLAAGVLYVVMKVAARQDSEDDGSAEALLPYTAGILGGLGAVAGGREGRSPWERVYPERNF
jgi:hypothetical protein